MENNGFFPDEIDILEFGFFPKYDDNIRSCTKLCSVAPKQESEKKN